LDIMSPARRVPLATLALLVAVPLPWLACGGGETKPPETPAGESSAAASSEAPASSDSAASAAPAPSASASDKSDKSDKSAGGSPSSDDSASSPPPAPSFGSTDCGKCVDKTCAKQEAACGKNTDCQATVDTIHGCSATAASCIGAASPPTDAKAKKLAASVESCAKKAIASKACKAKCK
jgi:hypothetical protein